MSDLFCGCGIEVELSDPDNFLKVKETLSRMGISSKPNGHKTLTQTCHILHKRGRYAIVHFKEMFILDGKPTVITQEDIDRRNLIVKLIARWGLVHVVTIEDQSLLAAASIQVPIRIVPHQEVNDWILRSKYSFKHRTVNDGRP